MRMAVDLRLRHWAGVLLGSAGFWKALSAWVGLLVLAGAAFTLGGPVVLVLVIAIVVTVVAFARVGAPSHWSHWLVVTSLALGAISGWYVWWVAGVAMDAADSFTPEPPAAAWGGAGVVVFLSSGLLLILAAVIAVRREIRPSAS